MDNNELAGALVKLAKTLTSTEDREAAIPTLDGRTITDMMNAVSRLKGDGVWTAALKFDSALTILTQNDEIDDKYLKLWKVEVGKMKTAQKDLQKRAERILTTISKQAGF